MAICLYGKINSSIAITIIFVLAIRLNSRLNSRIRELAPRRLYFLVAQNWFNSQIAHLWQVLHTHSRTFDFHSFISLLINSQIAHLWQEFYWLARLF